jgi:hypothetical protein
MRLLALLLDVPSIEAGHQYDFNDVPAGESGGEGEQGGIGAPWIIAAGVLALVAVAVLVSLNPSKAIARLKAVAPKALILVFIAVPLIAWAASSSSDEQQQSLVVERWTNDAGAPELIIWLGEKDLNTLETTNGKRTVQVECVGRDGQVVLDAQQTWPFVDNEAGYDAPHAHQPASREQLQRAERCRLLGTRVQLETDVTGALTP